MQDFCLTIMSTLGLPCYATASFLNTIMVYLLFCNNFLVVENVYLFRTVRVSFSLYFYSKCMVAVINSKCSKTGVGNLSLTEGKN